MSGSDDQLEPGTKVKYRKGVLPPGLRNVDAVGEVLDRKPMFSGQVCIRWPSGEEAEEYQANLEIVSEEGSIPDEDLNASNDEYQAEWGSLTYVAKWRGSSRTEPRSHRFETKYAAEQWAFARIAEGSQAWIENAQGKCVADFEELRRRRKAESPR